MDGYMGVNAAMIKNNIHASYLTMNYLMRKRNVTGSQRLQRSRFFWFLGIR